MANDETEFETSSDADTAPGSEQCGVVHRLERGTSVGRYVVIDFVDAGGMGAIYQAFDPELNRPVALKILSVNKQKSQDSIEADRAKSRMIREAQALAQLTHPNVVTVYDVGEYEDSIFIAMEFVEGRDLTVWRHETHPTYKQMLAKLIDAGRGLSAAHQAGIVHRDFKPGNVIVGNDGRVRVLDFGLARAADLNTESSKKRQAPKEALETTSALEPSLTESSSDLLTSSLTLAGSVLGTPHYMAPEQMDGKSVDERSDQFSFCVTLYESLYGKRPFSGHNVLQIFRSIQSADLRRPPGSKVPKWLDELILRGLSFDNEDRFASMDDLLDALQNDPAVLRKELLDRRKRMFTVIGSISLSLLIAGFGMWYVSTQASRLCEGAEDKLLGVWDQEVKAKVKQAFLGTKKYYAANSYQRVAKILDERAAQWTAMRTDACLATHDRGEQSEKMLDLRMRCLNRKLSEMDALVTLFATKTDAKIIQRAVQATFGLSLLNSCSDEEFLSAEMAPPENAALRKKVESLRKDLDVVMALRESGKYQEGIELALRSLEIARALGYQPAEVEALYSVGKLQEKTGKYKAAIRTMENCRLLADEAKYDEIRAKANNTLIFLVGYRLALLEEVDPFIKRARVVINRNGDRGVIKARWHNNLGVIFTEKGEHDQALAHLEKSLTIRTKTFGPQHPEVAKSNNNIGIVYYEKGEYDRAIEYYTKVFEIWKNAFGPEHPLIVGTNTNIGNAFEMMGEFRRALEHHQQALQIGLKTLGAEHPLVANTHDNMGRALYKMGEYDRALERFEQAMKIMQKSFGAENPNMTDPQSGIGDVYYQMGEYDRALDHFEQVLSILKKADQAKQAKVPEPLCAIGWIKLKRNKFREARACFDQVLALCVTNKCTAERKDHLPRAQFGLAQVLWHTGKDRERAIRLAVEALEFFKTAKSFQGKNIRKEDETWIKSHKLST